VPTPNCHVGHLVDPSPTPQAPTSRRARPVLDVPENPIPRADGGVGRHRHQRDDDDGVVVVSIVLVVKRDRPVLDVCVRCPQYEAVLKKCGWAEDGFTAGELGVELLGLPPAGVRREHAEVYAPVFLLPVHGVVEEDHLEAADHGGGDAVVISAGVEQHQHPDCHSMDGHGSSGRATHYHVTGLQT
jgi:hypothetical protein